MTWLLFGSQVSSLKTLKHNTSSPAPKESLSYWLFIILQHLIKSK